MSTRKRCIDMFLSLSTRYGKTTKCLPSLCGSGFRLSGSMNSMLSRLADRQRKSAFRRLWWLREVKEYPERYHEIGQYQYRLHRESIQSATKPSAANSRNTTAPSPRMIKLVIMLQISRFQRQSARLVLNRQMFARSCPSVWCA